MSSKLGGVELRDGEFYVDSEGTIVQVRFTHPGEDFPFTDSRGFRLMADGRYVEPEQDGMPVAVYGLVREFKGFDHGAAAAFLGTLVVNMDNPGMDDREFREFIKQSIGVAECKHGGPKELNGKTG